MATEIERKFRVDGDGWREAVMSRSRLTQAYLMTGENRSLRVRIENDNRATLCIKIGASSLQREEFEYPIPIADARAMVRQAMGNVIEKTRHLIHHHGYLWEVDVYHGVYDGLVIAEVELEQADETPPLPDWAGLEVTTDKRYSNASLATSDCFRELFNGPSS